MGEERIEAQLPGSVSVPGICAVSAPPEASAGAEGTFRPRAGGSASPESALALASG